jgi:hypothetical protein
MKFYLPKNLDLESVLKRHSPDFKFKIEYFKYLLTLISTIPANNKHLKLFNGFTPISSALLKNKIPSYNEYYKYLEEHNLIEIDRKYYQKERSMGYKFTDKYQTELLNENITLRTVRKYINKNTHQPILGKKQYKHLFKWYNNDLRIDSNQARKYNNTIYQYKSTGIIPLDKDREGFNKDPLIQYNCAEINIDKIENLDFNPHLDSTSHRFHSTITSLKSELRNFITYDNKQVTTIDLKNSQPYFSTSILRPEFWTQSSTGVNIYDINSNETKKYYLNQLQLSSPLMWEEFNKTQYQQGFQRYINAVESGFYEYMQNVLSQDLGEEYNSRQKVKETMFLVLYSKPGGLEHPRNAPKKAFANHFPEVYEYFSYLKKESYNMLARLLQSIESYCFLKVITKRIGAERPDLFQLTIHDNIATLSGNDDYVEEVMTKELIRLVGIRPSIHRDIWHPNNLQDHYIFLKESTASKDSSVDLRDIRDKRDLE